MAKSISMSGPTTATSPTNNNVDASLSPATIQAKFELAVAVSLFNWPALILAVQNQWGGAESEGKREWFAGAVADLFQERPQTDLEDVETTLLQVMLDEFEVNVDDDSAYDVAKQIVELRALTMAGKFEKVDALHAEWMTEKGKSNVRYQLVEGQGDDDGDSVDWESGDSADDDDDDDVEMGDATSTRQEPREKPMPEVDEDGFTKVTGRSRPR
ncbi:MAG: hypothetical protein M1833_003038 [Piccolia ochrophora]|nr:MAG: hypothetical protein M1833_003038 [Piccolia ochrophora]